MLDGFGNLEFPRQAPLCGASHRTSPHATNARQPNMNIGCPACPRDGPNILARPTGEALVNPIPRLQASGMATIASRAIERAIRAAGIPAPLIHCNQRKVGGHPAMRPIRLVSNPASRRLHTSSLRRKVTLAFDTPLSWLVCQPLESLGLRAW